MEFYICFLHYFLFIAILDIMALSILAAPMSVEQLSLISLPPKEQEQSEYDDSLNLLRNKY